MGRRRKDGFTGREAPRSSTLVVRIAISAGHIARFSGYTMSWINSAIAMLPEHFLLAGIVILIAVEIAAPVRKQGTLPLSLLAVIFAAAAAAWLSSNGFAFAAFAGHYSVDPSALLAKAIVLAFAVPVLLRNRPVAVLYADDVDRTPEQEDHASVIWSRSR